MKTTLFVLLIMASSQMILAQTFKFDTSTVMPRSQIVFMHSPLSFIEFVDSEKTVTVIGDTIFVATQNSTSFFVITGQIRYIEHANYKLIRNWDSNSENPFDTFRIYPENVDNKK